MDTGIGIVSYGCYVPAMRLQRQAITDAIGWAAPAVKSMATGERAVANWDEDSITMAVEAARHCLSNHTRETIKTVSLASTTFPFADRSNSGIVADALNLKENIHTGDLGGSRRAASAALIQALHSSHTNDDKLLLATDCREAKPGSPQEMGYGHAAAALLLGHDKPIAMLLTSNSIHRDLVDQFRSSDTAYDYALEKRWLRDEGYLKIVPEVIQQVLEKSACRANEIHHFILAGPAATAKTLAKMLKLNNANIIDNLQNTVGDCGTAHPVLLLGSALDQAEAAQNILLVGFGQGADAVLLKTTEHIKNYSSDFKQNLIQGRSSSDYIRYLVLRRQLNIDYGIRSERDNRTALSTLYRKRHAISGFIGGRCRDCDMLQFPKTAVCVRCSSLDSQQAESFAELKATVKSFTEDWQAYTPCPPLVYGNVTFPDGANLMMEFTDINPGELAVDKSLRMVFRIKDVDDKRGFRRYFWKSIPEDSNDG